MYCHILVFFLAIGNLGGALGVPEVHSPYNVSHHC